MAPRAAKTKKEVKPAELKEIKNTTKRIASADDISIITKKIGVNADEDHKLEKKEDIVTKILENGKASTRVNKARKNKNMEQDVPVEEENNSGDSKEVIKKGKKRANNNNFQTDVINSDFLNSDFPKAKGKNGKDKSAVGKAVPVINEHAEEDLNEKVNTVDKPKAKGRNTRNNIPVDTEPVINEKAVSSKSGGKGKKKAQPEEKGTVEKNAESDKPTSRNRKTVAKDEPSVPADNRENQPKQSAKSKRAAPKTTDGASSYETSEPPSKKSKNEENKTLKNKSVTAYESIDFSNSSTNSQGQLWNMKICSWNVDGIRAWVTKGGLEYIKHEKPDILCLQEVKCSVDKLPQEAVSIPGYHPYWLCSDKDGYAGVGIYTTKMAINVRYGLEDEELDSEGRIITAEYEQFYLICTYTPNAGRKLVTLPKKLKWNEVFQKYVQELDAKKPVIICGDMNVAHNEIDLTNPKTNKKNAGFTVEERADMTKLLNAGFVDTFRHLYPDKTGAYTFWTYMMNSRAKNVGWRLDYMIVSERLLPALCDSVIRSEVYGSDHCPIALFLHLSSVPKIPSE